MVLAAAIVGFTAGAVIDTRAVGRETLESVSRQPARFTELYFADPGRLPRHLRTSRTNEFRFVIANHERRPERYVFEVTVRSGYGTDEIARDTVGVDAAGASLLLVRFRPRMRDTAYRVTVRLRGRPERIDFAASS